MDSEENMESSTPFQGEAQQVQLYRGGRSAAILAEIMAAFREQVGIVTLIGAEGSGKSVLCKMVEEEREGSSKTTILLPRALRSFEEIVREVARACDLESLAETDGNDTKKIFMDLVSALRMRGESLLLICDEAENMYLATFERIRKALDEVNRQGGGLQLLFAGRRRLAGYFEQLHLCDFNEVAEKQLALPEYDGGELLDYLNFYMRPPEGNAPQEVFTREAADAIAAMADGNLRKANSFAHEALQAARADMSSMVFPKHVKGDGGVRRVQPKIARHSKRFAPLGQLPFPSAYLGGGLVALVLLLMFFVFSGGEEEGVVKDELAVEERVASTGPVQERVEAPQKTSDPAGHQVHKPEKKESAEVVRSGPDPEKPVSTEEEIREKATADDPVAESSRVEPAFEGETVEEKRLVPVVEPVPPPVQHTPVAIAPVAIVERESGSDEVPELTGPSKVVKEGGRQIHPDSVKRIPGEVVAEGGPSGDRVITALVAAGERWRAGENEDAFSIQLMALVSEEAEGNLKKILLEPEYREIAHKLVLLKRPSDPPVLLVFYGLYPSMAAARNARNNMPIFLRKHHPYALSIKRAVEKGRLE
ncbi:MAG: ATP-binding protein [Thermodesulfobacteriota bacterium]